MNSYKQLVNPSDRMLRQFGGIWLLFFGAIAFRQEFHHNRPTVAITLAVIALVGGVVGMVSPRHIKPVFVGWMTLAFPIGWVVSRVVLGVIFYGVFTPLAFILRLTGRDALVLKPRPSATTYWHTKAQSVDKAQYLRQY